MRRKLFSLWLALGLLTISGIPAYAITFGEEDVDAHPYVGLAVFDAGGGVTWRCSGVLLSSTVFLTAGHCTNGTLAARVWFGSAITDPNSGGIAADEIHTHPDFDIASQPNTSDIGVLILSEAVNSIPYGVLSPLGVLDLLSTRRGLQDRIFDVVGYGFQSLVPDVMEDLVRYKATTMFVEMGGAKTDGYHVRLSNNPGLGQGTGGACFGDSGAPVFLQNTNMIVAIQTLAPTPKCVGTDLAYRTDISNAQDFINSFLP
jgi:hypothetical protein